MTDGNQSPIANRPSLHNLHWLQTSECCIQSPVFLCRCCCQLHSQIGSFVIFGKYKKDMTISFTKQYVGEKTHAIAYFGDIDTETETNMAVITGDWGFPRKSGPPRGGDKFRMAMSTKKNHVMLSYQWGSQETVKRVADYLKQRGVDIWFDIDGTVHVLGVLVLFC